MIWLRLMFVALITVLTGCAFGQKINYTGVSTFHIPDKTPKAISLAVCDKRPDVVAGDHSLQWVGYSRPPLGIPYGVHTQSGRPLSDDLASLLESSLAVHGVVAQSVATQPYEDRQIVVAHLVDRQNPKNVVVTLNDWKTDSYVGLTVSFHYSVNVEVLDRSGTSLGHAARAGVRDLSSSYPLLIAVAEVFQELFNAPEIKSALERK